MQTCSQCGFQLNSDSNFCSSCGKIVALNNQGQLISKEKSQCLHHNLFPAPTSEGRIICRDCLGVVDFTRDKKFAFGPQAEADQIQTRKGVNIYVVFSLFVTLAIIVAFAVSSSDIYKKAIEDSQQNSTKSSTPSKVSENAGPSNIFLEKPLSDAINMNSYQIARSQGEDVLKGCPNVFSLRLGANCIYGWYMRQIGDEKLITVSDLKQQLSPGRSLDYVLHQLFPSVVYFDAVVEQFIWLGSQDEKNGITYSNY